MTETVSHEPDRLRVAIVFHRSDVVGGASVYSLSLARGLRRRGHEACFFLPGPGHFTDQLEQEGIPWRAVPGLGRTVHPRRNAAAFRSLQTSMQAFDPHVISAQASTAGALCRLLRHRIGRPVVYTPHSWSFAHGTPPLEAGAGWLVEACLRGRSDAVITVSEYERDLGIERHVLIPDRTHVIHNGVADPVAALRTSHRDGGPLEVVSVARFEKQKDHETLLEAFARLDHREVELVLIGAGALQEERRNQAERLGIASRVRWLGALDDVASHLSRADVFTLTSRWESLPLSIIEAMAAGLPVVATDVGGVGELVVDRSTGALVPPGDPDALATALDRFLADPVLRCESGRAGRDRYERYFTEDQMLEKTLGLYEQVGYAGRTRAA